MPLLEALSFGKPVISSNTSSLPEVVGDGGILIDPYQPESICDAMFQLERDANFYQKLSMLATQQATKFSWERSAHQTKAIYESF